MLNKQKSVFWSRYAAEVPIFFLPPTYSFKGFFSSQNLIINSLFTLLPCHAEEKLYLFFIFKGSYHIP